MKFFGVLSFLVAFNFCQGQGLRYYEKVCIYIVPKFSSRVISENENPNFVRVNAEYQVSIIDQSMIKAILKKMDSTSCRSDRTLQSTSDFNNCWLVVDFIKGAKINYSVCFDKSMSFAVEDFDSMIKVNKSDDSLSCFLSAMFPSFIPEFNCDHK